ncbi:MAG: protein kinase, partial [Planctomycetales bacterium]|nr:protein kinase [Planctomycetales bacterium]
MQEPASLLNPARADDALPAGEGRKRGPMKFAYASGTRPLEGYTIKRGVGAGGFGEVYYATSDAGKEVALKRIQRNLDVELRGVSQCLNLKHANLVALYDIRYDDDEQAWVVMEYVSG